ncbi:MAG: PQQ-dependent sugar dehydrogenase [Limisphaerales bacterium]
MKRVFPFLGRIICLLGLAAISTLAQPIPQIQLQRVFPNLQLDARPVWMCQPPDGSGRFFIVEQTGHIFVMGPNSDGSDAKEFLDISDLHPMFNNEDGLLSIAFHPGFKTNGLFYIYYTRENTPADIQRLDNGRPVSFPYRSVVSEMKVSASDPNKGDRSTERIIFEVLQPYWNHKGGELVFGPDGYLYLGLGDGGLATDPFNSAQNCSSYLGKMLRFDVNSRATIGSGWNARQLQYGIPSDNPFVNEMDMNGQGPRHEIYAYGLRNPWRYSFDRQTGDLWVGDVGQDLWEEVDLIVKGGNYGWNVREGAHHFKPGPPGAQYIDPVMEYPHNPNLLSQSLFPNHTIGLCIIGGYVYRGTQFPSLNGIYIYGDYNLGTIWGFRYDRAADKVTDQDLMLKQPKNITSFAEDNAGELYALMQDGGIYHLTAK